MGKQRKLAITIKSKTVCKHCAKTTHTSSQCFNKPPKQPKPCKFCQSTAHVSWQCRNKPDRTTQVKTKVQSMNQRGPVFTKWMATRRKWFKANKADHYVCYLCGKWMQKNETTLDHIKSRSRHPELRFELDNLAPSCLGCNALKGSLSLEEMQFKQAA